MKLVKSTSAALMAAVIIGLDGMGYGQAYTPAYTSPPVPAAQQGSNAPLVAAQLDQLLGPIALYPDPLLSTVLAAATYPQDVTAAAQWLQSFPTPSEDDINAQPWDPSVKALVHYPTVVQMMASQPDWMAALGSAFATQQQDVMDSVQRLRAQAQAANTLASNAQQQVVADNGAIQILPVQPDVIYIPSYDPTVVYVGNPGYTLPWITYGPPCPVGIWLNFGFDWRARSFYRGVQWGRDWRRPVFDHGHPWVHNPGRPIPRPPYPVRPPHGVPGRGGDIPGRGPVFDPRLPPRPVPRPVPGPRPPERPVIGIPSRPVPPRGPEVRPIAPVPPFKPIVRPQPVAPPRVERPVIGIPRPVPEPIARPGPAPIARPGPAPAPRPGPTPGPSPVFRNGGSVSVQSDRGHSSMRR
jgi:Protein of unknown function (DUF3300)